MPDAASSASALRPPLKWAGGKRWLVAHLRPLWEQHGHRRLVEPLCGGLAVSIGLQPRRALLNDINPHVINFYRQVQAGLRIELALDNAADTYYAHRRAFNGLVHQGRDTGPLPASLFYYLNRTGYNGLCRFNRSGEFNVPFGRHKAINYQTDFSDYQALFADWEFTAVDFEALELASDDFIYADPPYDVVFTQYAQGGFGWEDQVRFASWLAHHPGPVVLSNQATDRIVTLYRDLGFRLVFLKAPRLISCNGNRTPALEVLATRNLA